MYKVGDFVWVQNAVVMSFGVVKEVPETEDGEYKVQLVHCEGCDSYVKGSLREVHGRNLYDGVEHLDVVIQRQENYLNNLKMLKGVTAPKVLKYLGIGEK